MRINGFDHNSPNAARGEAKTAANSVRTSSQNSKQMSGDVADNSDGAQLSKLSSVLNGLENGASAMRRHVQQAMSAVRGGTYRVDSVQLSKRIVGEALGG
jgi:anti-sigma28 factor (negative regulator of flagellin synthesis)